MTTDATPPRRPFYITTPIYYVNDAPHIGHAYTSIVADVLARYHRLMGDDVFFLTGTDEHGQKVERAAKARGLEPQQHCDEMVVRFKECWERLGIGYDRFIRTTDADHTRNVQDALQRVYDQGDIYQAEYKGYYHVADETFVTADKVTQAEMDAGDVVQLSEKNYFFKLAKYQQWLIDYIQANPGFIQPEARRNWVLGHLREPLADLCISRPKDRLNWGIEIPFDRDYVCYVWFDALLNYLTGIGYTFGAACAPSATERWRGCTHLIGKDILQHHAIYWPIMLKALGVEQPEHVLAHGWWMGNEGEKISKRRGGTGAWLWLADEYGSDAFRYFLIREMVLGQDSTISEELFITRVNSELVNDLGNLISRAGKMAVRQFAGTVPALGQPGAAEQALLEAGRLLLREVPALADAFATQTLVERIAAYVREINVYFDGRQPWTLAKSPEKLGELATVLRTALEGVALATALFSPVIPGKAREVFAALGGTVDVEALRLDALVPGSILKDGAPLSLEQGLFPRIERRKPAEGDAPAPAAAAKQADAKPAEAKGKKKQEEPIGVITIDDFTKVELRTAIVLAAERVEGSDRLLKLRLNDGPGERTIVSGIAQFYTPEQMLGRRVILVANLQPATIFGIESHGMLLAARSGKKLVLLTLDTPDFPAGCRAS